MDKDMKMSSQPPSIPDKKNQGMSSSAPKRSYQRSSNNSRPTEAEAIKKVVFTKDKIAIRELPSNNFNEDNFKECLNKFLETLHIDPESIDFLHFIEGKLSRKRGPLSGAGFLCARTEESFLAISRASPAEVPFLPDENTDAQPNICLASYQRRFNAKSRGRNDKLVNTIEEDPDFLAFQKKLQEPVEKRPSAEVQLEAREKARAAEQEAEEAFVKKETAKLKALANRKEKGRGNSSRTERAIRLAVAANLANKESAKAIKFMKEKADKKSAERKLHLKEQAKKKLLSSGGKVSISSNSKDKDREDSSSSNVKVGKKDRGRDKEEGVKGRAKGKGKDKDKGKERSDSVNPNTSAGAASSRPVVMLKKRPGTTESVTKNESGIPVSSAPSSSKGVKATAATAKDIPSGQKKFGKAPKETSLKEAGKGRGSDKKKRGKGGTTDGAKTDLQNQKNVEESLQQQPQKKTEEGKGKAYNDGKANKQNPKVVAPGLGLLPGGQVASGLSGLGGGGGGGFFQQQQPSAHHVHSQVAAGLSISSPRVSLQPSLAPPLPQSNVAPPLSQPSVAQSNVVTPLSHMSTPNVAASLSQSQFSSTIHSAPVFQPQLHQQQQYQQQHQQHHQQQDFFSHGQSHLGNNYQGAPHPPPARGLDANTPLFTPPSAYSAPSYSAQPNPHAAPFNPKSGKR